MVLCLLALPSLTTRTVTRQAVRVKLAELKGSSCMVSQKAATLMVMSSLPVSKAEKHRIAPKSGEGVGLELSRESRQLDGVIRVWLERGISIALVVHTP